MISLKRLFSPLFKCLCDFFKDIIDTFVNSHQALYMLLGFFATYCDLFKI